MKISPIQNFPTQLDLPYEFQFASRSVFQNGRRRRAPIEPSARWRKRGRLRAVFAATFVLFFSVLFFSVCEVAGALATVQAVENQAVENSLPAQDSVEMLPQSLATANVVAGAKKTSPSRSLDFEKRGAITYREIGGETLKCDVYVPEGVGPYPAVIAIHGGAWRQGSKIALLRHAWRLAKSGYVVVAINYRHAPEHPFPAQVHDCKFAVRWMRANAKEYKIDPNRIAAFGYSAGGHLAALLGTTNKADGLEGLGELPSSNDLSQYSSAVQATVIGGAPCEFDWIGENANTLVYWLGEKRANAPDVYLKASPTNYVTADDPPFYIFHGEQDMIVPLSSSNKLHCKLLDNGVQSKREVALSLGHIATFSDLSWMTRAIGFLDEQLKKE